jgi:hypothetical protein
MKVLANELRYLMDAINFELTDTVNLMATPYAIKFTWQEDETQMAYSLRKKSGIIPTTSTHKVYELETYRLYGLEEIIKSQSIQFNEESDFLIEFDFKTGRKNSVALSVVDSENNGVKDIPLKEVFDSFKLPRSIVDAEFYSASWQTRSHLRLAKYIAENSINPVFLEFVDGNDCDRLKISSFSDEIFLGSVCADCANGSKFPLIRSVISVDTSTVGKMLSFKDFSYPKWAEYVEGNLSLLLGDWGDSITAPYEFSDIDFKKYSQHLFGNKADGWVKVDKNTLQKQLEAICSPVTFTEKSVQLPIKSISQSEGEITVEALDHNHLTKIGLSEFQATVWLDSWEIPDKKTIYSNIIQLELDDGYLTIIGNDDQKRKIKLKGSNPDAFGNWQGDGKKLIKILSLIKEFDDRLEIVMEHPKLQIQTTSGASILLLGCDLVGINDIYEIGNETSLNRQEKLIQILPEIEETGLELDDVFLHKMLQIRKLQEITQKITVWVEALEIDHENLEEICDTIRALQALFYLLPEDDCIPVLDECFQDEYGSYRYGFIEEESLEEFIDRIEVIKRNASHGLGCVIQYCCELPSLMQYLF